MKVVIDIDDNLYTRLFDNGVDNYADAVGMATAIRNGTPLPEGWIPVSERLPEIHQDVLLSLRSLDVVVGFRAETEPYFHYQGDYIEPQNVLAWMPLPEPYKAESIEDVLKKIITKYTEN